MILQLLLAGGFLTVLLPGIAAARPLGLFAAPVNCRDLAGNTTVLGVNSWDRYLMCDSDTESVINFRFPADIILVVIALLEIVMRVAVYLAVGVIIYGGFKFMISEGNPEGIQEAKSIITQAIVGLVIALMSIVIVNFFFTVTT